MGPCCALFASFGTSAQRGAYLDVAVDTLAGRQRRLCSASVRPLGTAVQTGLLQSVGREAVRAHLRCAISADSQNPPNSDAHRIHCGCIGGRRRSAMARAMACRPKAKWGKVTTMHFAMLNPDSRTPASDRWTSRPGSTGQLRYPGRHHVHDDIADDNIRRSDVHPLATMVIAFPMRSGSCRYWKGN
jgi:hypothetical protein